MSADQSESMGCELSQGPPGASTGCLYGFCDQGNVQLMCQPQGVHGHLKIGGANNMLRLLGDGTAVKAS